MVENLEGEIWKDIQGYEGLYQVSNMGRIKALPKKWITGRHTELFHKERLVKIFFDSCRNYLKVGLSNNGVTKNKTTHRIIAAAFIPNPENKPCVNHINGIKSDNRIENLEWCTRSENVRHAVLHGLQKSTLNHKQKVSKKVLDTKTGKTYSSAHLAAKTLGYSPAALYKWLTGVNPNKTTLVYLENL